MDSILEKQLESTAQIRFQDCDPFRHLNNARYTDYFMNARFDQLLQFYNFNLFEVAEKTNHGWVVTKNHTAFLSPVTMLEQVIIRTQLIEMTENRITVEGVMLDNNARRVKAVTWIEFTFVNLLTGRTANHTDDLMNLFRAVVVGDIFAPDGFNGRVDTLKAQFKRQPIPESQ